MVLEVKYNCCLATRYEGFFQNPRPDLYDDVSTLTQLFLGLLTFLLMVYNSIMQDQYEKQVSKEFIRKAAERLHLKYQRRDEKRQDPRDSNFIPYTRKG